MELIEYAFFFVLAISILVTVHEFGHFWVARCLGVKVLRFSVGFGRALFSWRGKRDDTEYVIAAIPLGGYVKMLDETEGEVPAHERHAAFNCKPLWVRTLVVLAGPAFNFAFAIVAYALTFMIGVSGVKPIVGEVVADSLAARSGFIAGQQIVSVDAKAVATWEAVVQQVVHHTLDGREVLLQVQSSDGVKRTLPVDLGRIKVDDLTQGQFFETLGLTPQVARIEPVIGTVIAGGAAQEGGLMSGDWVLSADGVAIDSWRQWVDIVRAHPGQALQLVVRRGAAEYPLTLTPRAARDGDAIVGRIGATVDEARVREARQRFAALERYGLVDAARLGAIKTLEMTQLTLKMLWRMLTRDVSVKNLSGPISIAQYAGVSASIGAVQFIGFLAIVSVSLGILNLLPIPLLDGGHLLYYIAEAVRGKPLSDSVQYAGQRLGIALLIGLMSLAFYNDLSRVFG